ncbi:MAG: UDP-N-acetylglucosamine 2-epimerase (non-hydrolyzing) [Gracilimonas sp.]
MKKILIAFGTRPEVIKLAPVIKALNDDFELILFHSGQHQDLVEPMFTLFGITPDIDLKIMKPGQDLFSITSELLPKLKTSLEKYQPDYVMVQGDTTTSYLAALSAFYSKIPVLHVEAGLRSHNIYNPFPEEMNRKQISQLSHIHFAPTELNKQNLLNECVQGNRIHVTGNTVVDALQLIKSSDAFKDATPEILSRVSSDEKLMVLTAHRRENHGEPLINIFKAVDQLLKTVLNLKVIFPVHPNPNVKHAIENAGVNSERFVQTSPLEYLPFLHVLGKADLILTDSGGIQEEAAALGKPILVLRNETERHELIEAGLGELVGTDKTKIIERAKEILKSENQLKPSNIFGDGTAAIKIRNILKDQL